MRILDFRLRLFNAFLAVLAVLVFGSNQQQLQQIKNQFYIIIRNLRCVDILLVFEFFFIFILIYANCIRFLLKFDSNLIYCSSIRNTFRFSLSFRGSFTYDDQWIDFWVPSMIKLRNCIYLFFFLLFCYGIDDERTRQRKSKKRFLVANETNERILKKNTLTHS